MAAQVVELTCSNPSCGRTFTRLAKDVRQMQKRGSKPYCKPECVQRRNSSPDAGTSKTCTSCKKTKPLDEFWAQKNGFLGKTARCKDCLRKSIDREALKEYHREYYLENRETILAKQRELGKSPEHRAYKAQKTRDWISQNRERSRLNARRWRAMKTYGLTLEEYDEILARGCAICKTHAGRIVGKRIDGAPPPPRLCIDHDHTNGKVRDALCHSCNTGLGSFQDDPALLRAAADYLESHR